MTDIDNSLKKLSEQADDLLKGDHEVAPLVGSVRNAAMYSLDVLRPVSASGSPGISTQSGPPQGQGAAPAVVQAISALTSLHAASEAAANPDLADALEKADEARIAATAAETDANKKRAAAESAKTLADAAQARLISAVTGAAAAADQAKATKDEANARAAFIAATNKGDAAAADLATAVDIEDDAKLALAAAEEAVTVERSKI